MEMSDLWPIQNIRTSEHLSSLPSIDTTPCQPHDCVTNDRTSQEDQLPIDFSFKRELKPDLGIFGKPSNDESTAMCDYYQTSVFISAQPGGQQSLNPNCEQLSIKCECDSQSSELYSIKGEQIHSLKWENSSLDQIPQMNDYSSVWKNNRCESSDFSISTQLSQTQRVFDFSSIPYIKRAPVTEPSSSYVPRTTMKQVQNSCVHSALQIGGEGGSGTIAVPETEQETSVRRQKLELYPFWIRPFDTSLKINKPMDPSSLNISYSNLIPQEFTITNMIGLPLSCTTRRRPRLLAPKVEDDFVKPDTTILPFPNVKQCNRTKKFRSPLQSIQNFVNQPKREKNTHMYTRKKAKKIRSKVSPKRKEKAKNEQCKPTKSRKPLRSIRSADRCDPNFKGAIVCLKTQVKDENCYLDISASFCNIKSTRSCGLTKKPWYGSGSLASMQEPGHMSDEEGITIHHPGFCYSNENGSKICASCGTRRTPLWRDAEDGTPLCNACGIRFKKYRVRCSKCWHIPKKDIKTYPNCPHCGSSLKMSFGKKCSW